MTRAAAHIGPISAADQTQSPLDLFLIFIGANIVATTFQVGASLASSFTLSTVVRLIVLGSLAGGGLVAVLVPLGSRLRVPSIIVARAALGIRGAGIVAIVLYVSNFAWIALNDVIAASALSRVLPGSQTIWAVALGLVATAVVARGPRAVALADRVAVPLLLVVSVVLTVACLRMMHVVAAPPDHSLSWSRGFDVVIGYQVSWILMFADYSRYTRSARASGIAVLLSLALTSAWIMPLGAIAARAAGSSDPGAMLAAVHVGAAGALLLVLATLTTNFVNIYMSSLAWKSLFPGTSDGAAIWSIGLIGTVLSALPGVWLDQFSNFMVALGAVLVPVGGVLVAHFYLPARDAHVSLSTESTASASLLYDADGPLSGFVLAGVAAWALGVVAFFAAGSIGGTIPSLAVSMGVYVALTRIHRSSQRGHDVHRGDR